jgi:hypothetical protein
MRLYLRTFQLKVVNFKMLHQIVLDYLLYLIFRINKEEQGKYNQVILSIVKTEV